VDRDFLIDLFSAFGPVTLRRMFSGYGISVDGTNFALALRAGLYFRADATTIPQFEDEGSKPFQYQNRARTVTVNSYWQLPARLFDDPDELSNWAKLALAAAQRAAVKKRPKASKAKARTAPKRKSKAAAKTTPRGATMTRKKAASGKTPRGKETLQQRRRKRQAT
jgi:DNA transformation protein